MPMSRTRAHSTTRMMRAGVHSLAARAGHPCRRCTCPPRHSRCTTACQSADPPCLQRPAAGLTCVSPRSPSRVSRGNSKLIHDCGRRRSCGCGWVLSHDALLAMWRLPWWWLARGHRSHAARAPVKRMSTSDEADATVCEFEASGCSLNLCGSHVSRSRSGAAQCYCFNTWTWRTLCEIFWHAYCSGNTAWIPMWWQQADPRAQVVTGWREEPRHTIGVNRPARRRCLPPLPHPPRRHRRHGAPAANQATLQRRQPWALLPALVATCPGSACEPRPSVSPGSGRYCQLRMGCTRDTHIMLQARLTAAIASSDSGSTCLL